uniref:Reverse transcriptase Ty1/copia-type domain-containing protein n=1 Tax=Solanum lycopersicum TaxID=4081 RepID=A0A3Q7IJA0_SOLLC
MAVSSSTNRADTPFADITHFRSLIGALQYLAITRPDIQFAVNRVAQRIHQPSEHDYHCLKRILRYIFGTLGRGLLIRTGDLELRGFLDSDWANDKNDRKSTSGFLVFLRPNLISWCTKKQPKVSRSSTEAEYRALALLAAETISRPNFQSKIGPRDLTRDSKPESKLRFDPDIRLKTQVLNWNPTSTLIPIDPDSRLYTRLSNRDSILILIRDLTSELGPNPDT